MIPTPFVSTPIAIDHGWLDPNGHVNMACFMVLNERGLDQAWTAMGIGWEYARETGLSTFAAEVHTRYLRELLGDARPVVTFRALGLDEKRLHGIQRFATPQTEPSPPLPSRCGCTSTFRRGGSRHGRRTCVKTWRCGWRPTAASNRSTGLAAASPCGGSSRLAAKICRGLEVPGPHRR